jgi:alpha-glucoside transport system substrate-binding protein
MFKKSGWKILTFLVVLSMILVACAGGAATQPPAAEVTEAPAEEVTEAPVATEPPTEEPVATEAMTEEAAATEAMTEEAAATEAAGGADLGEIVGPPGGELEKALAGEYSGTTVVVDGPFTAPDDEYFRQSMQAFEEATGITVDYIGNKEFETSISIRVDAGDAPDIADFPQPGLLARFVQAGKIVDPTTFIPQEWLTQQYNQSWLDMATMEGPNGPQVAAVFHRFNAKSLVWYPKDDFDEAGYEIPQTWEEMIALSDMIVSDGDAPWCVGIESQAATGWPATDWMEEIILRTTSLENYDAWVRGELDFSSPEVTNAAETLGELWFTDGYVFGGREAIISTYFGDAPAPMFEEPPRCWLHKQGNFITGFFPEDAEAGVDYDFFYLPPIDEQYGKPFLVAGDLMAMFNDRPEVRALMEYFTLPQSASGWLTNGGALAAHLTATPEMYGVDLERGIAELVAQATSFRFDGSDLMPGEVGSGSFWKGMTDWVSGAAELDTVLQEIDASWPEQ